MLGPWLASRSHHTGSKREKEGWRQTRDRARDRARDRKRQRDRDERDTDTGTGTETRESAQGAGGRETVAAEREREGGGGERVSSDANRRAEVERLLRLRARTAALPQVTTPHGGGAGIYMLEMLAEQGGSI